LPVRVTTKPGIRARRRAQKLARILSASRALLRHHGHENLSLREVARRAGLSPAGMYEFFDTREHLVDALAREANAALSRALRSAVSKESDPVERMVRIGLAYIGYAQKHPTDFLLLFGRVSGRRSLIEEVPPESEYAQIRTAVADVIGVGRLGGADPRFLEALAYGFWSSMHGMAMLQLTHLAGFEADFATAHRLVLESIARSWQRIDWKSVLETHTNRCTPARPTEELSSSR